MSLFDELLDDIEQISLNNYKPRQVLDFTSKYLLSFISIILLLEAIYNGTHTRSILENNMYVKSCFQIMLLYKAHDNPKYLVGLLLFIITTNTLINSVLPVRPLLPSGSHFNLKKLKTDYNNKLTELTELNELNKTLTIYFPGNADYNHDKLIKWDSTCNNMIIQFIYPEWIDKSLFQDLMSISTIKAKSIKHFDKYIEFLNIDEFNEINFLCWSYGGFIGPAIINNLMRKEKFKDKIKRIDMFAPLNSPFQGISIEDNIIFTGVAQLVKGFLSTCLKYMKSTGDEIKEIKQQNNNIIINITVDTDDETIYFSKDYNKHPLVVEFGIKNLKINCKSETYRKNEERTHISLQPYEDYDPNDNNNPNQENKINYIIYSCLGGINVNLV
uniref:DUF676 domain-containing protein n=1 Tax=Megaviridae environmental sample TaxID=1737588 RepID=A0A5J6VIM5_9VIRU|nr:MAG: hypothetical protein [Megaviridae environmental sample]